MTTRRFASILGTIALLLAVAVALDPSLVGAPLLPVAVETTGTLTRGATVVDRRPGRSPSGPTCRVALQVDAGRVLRLFEERVCGEHDHESCQRNPRPHERCQPDKNADNAADED